MSFVNSSMAWVNEQKYLATTDGTRVEQYLIRGVPNFTVTAINREKGDFQTRSALAQGRQAGWEYTTEYDWIGEAKQAGEEAVEKLKAKPIEPGKYDLVLHPSHLFLTIHESVGHSTELDRALLWEANYAGTSFLTPDKTNKLQFGSKIVNFFADRTQEGGLGDDRLGRRRRGGTKMGFGQRRKICRLADDARSGSADRREKIYGLFARRQLEQCSVSANAECFARSRRKGNVSAEELISDVKNGIMIHGRGSYSIDQQRYNFQFGGQTFWEIKNGKVVGMLKDVAYQSRTTDFWNACDALGGRSTYELPGTFNDGKGQPGQSNAVSHGCPVARFRNINVLNTAS